ncbi:MAG: matrixin family metalloprotease [Deltaproteobacteria bacterium]|nr:matrixin family metalloprotease [Deltaproteobacteria bacterium]
MRGPNVVVAVALLLGTSTAVIAAPSSANAVTVYLDRDGHVDEESGATIPRYGGSERNWAATAACVKRQFAPFRVEVVERRPAGRDFITAVIGGKASMVGLDDRHTNGVGPYSGSVIRDATVFVFSGLGTAEADIENICAVTAHEVGHALGLDHTYYCGDMMSYFLDRCGARKFLDVNAPCGEDSKRACGTGEATQNSYRRLVALVGLRGGPALAVEDADDSDRDAADGGDADDSTDDADQDSEDSEDREDREDREDSEGSEGSDDADDAAGSAPACGARHGRRGSHQRGGRTTTHVEYVRRGNRVYQVTTYTTRR